MWLCLQASLDAQIRPDVTLPNNSVVSRDQQTIKIDGGTTVGDNLFHSFSEFSVPTNIEAHFNNNAAIRNILSRVTGNNISEIDGLIRANGASNLFLLNPNGIIFGPDAALNIGGSFVGTTADSIRFADGSEFSANLGSTPPLLSISQPIGLNFRGNPEPINVLGTGHSLTIDSSSIFGILIRDPDVAGLKAAPGESFVLVGGDVLFDGGLVTADSGQIEIGAVESGLVGINDDFQLDYANVDSFKDVELIQRALLDASGVEPGSVQLNAETVSLDTGAVVLNQNFGVSPDRPIQVNASTLKIKGTAADQRIRTQLNSVAFGPGTGADIQVFVTDLILEDGARIDTVNVGDGGSGNILIEASESISLSGTSPSSTDFVRFTSQIASRSQGDGNGGNLDISTKRITSRDGGNIVSAANLARGLGGNVTVRASESIELIGVDPVSLFSSSIGTATVFGGDAGNVFIETPRLLLVDGGRVDASTFLEAKAGNIEIIASESVEVRGTVPGSLNPSLISAVANELDPILQDIFGLPPRPFGDSGNVKITTPNLNVSDGGEVSVRNDGLGRAGELIINSNSVFVNNRGKITASTFSGDGGTITINAQEFLNLGGAGLISSTAGGTGDGGQIDISSKFLVAEPGSNSDITANAFGGRGGTINIASLAMFGIQVRDSLTPDNDITAFSELEPLLNVTTFDPNAGLLSIQEAVIDPNALIAQNTCRRGTQSELSVTGRGGLPPTAADDLTVSVTKINLIEPVSQPLDYQASDSAQNTRIVTQKSKAVLPTQGWVLTEKGELLLTEYNPASPDAKRWRSHISGCNVSPSPS
ncbi:MAG: filamentous hemagglutinin N-terminal domain-containing protein [Cyanobacteria bacterium P01_H01_bin.15]